MIMFYDLETTGMSREKDSILEVAAIVIDDNCQIIDIYNEYVKPQRPVPPLITQLTGITNEMVANALCESVVLNNFMGFIKKHNPAVIAGHNIKSFDNNWIIDKTRRYGIENVMPENYLDTLELARQMHKENKFGTWKYVTKTGRPSFKLEHLIDYYELGTQDHRAINDVKNNILVYKNFLQEEDKSDYGF